MVFKKKQLNFMQSRFTARGQTIENKEVILAFELVEEALQVNLHVVPMELLTNEQVQQLEKVWTEGGEFDFPEGTVFTNPDVNNDSILPQEIRSEETGKIRGKQNEWAFRILTNKLWEAYLIELTQLQNKAAELSTYSRELFEEVKSFWERVLEHKKERDISQSKLDEIKDEVNKIFDKLKELRKKEVAEFEQESSSFRNDILSKIDEVKSRMTESAVFKELFEELRQLQGSVRGKKLLRADENTLKKAFDAAFQHLQEVRNQIVSHKNASRIENLTKIVSKLEKSLQRDKSDKEYYSKKLHHPKANALEIQLAKLKLKMLEEAISSKEEKIADIKKTIEKLKVPKRKTVEVLTSHSFEQTQNHLTDTEENVLKTADDETAKAEDEETARAVEINNNIEESKAES
jgi:hypothetical protein